MANGDHRVDSGWSWLGITFTRLGHHLDGTMSVATVGNGTHDHAIRVTDGKSQL
jgi:hypothetical protein